MIRLPFASKGAAALLGALTFTALIAASAQTRAGETPSANDCVHILRSEQDNGINYAVNNACGESLSCTIGWTLECSNAAGKVTARERSNRRFSLNSEDGKEIFAAADKCTSGWQVADVSWNCTRAK